MNEPAVDIIPIGGLGQFGMNCTLVRAGDEVAVIDAGMAFPRGEAWGVDAIVPDLEELLQNGLRTVAIVLTHGHEDHIGGVAYVMDHTSCPVYGSDLTLGFVRERLRQQGRNGSERLKEASGGERITAGPFTIEFLDVTHSVPGSFALVIETPVGRIVHSADFKLDPTPVSGPPTDLARLAEHGKAGVKVLLLDSTNAGREGSTPSEKRVGEAFGRLLAQRPGRVFVTTFSSHIHRIQQFVDCAVRAGRKVAVLGRRMSASIEIARATRRLHLAAGAQVSADEAMNLPPERSLIIAGGSQGESTSAMTRIAHGDHPGVSIDRGDTVVHSARAIPGSEVAIGRMLDELARRGADVIGNGAGGLHVSGHASADDLSEVLDLVAPETLVPVHGDVRHLLECAALAERRPHPPDQILLAENGDIIRVDRAGARIDGKVAAKPMFVDRACDRIEPEVLHERRHLGSEGILLPIVVIERSSRRLLASPEVLSRGFAVPTGDGDLLRAAADAVSETMRASRSDATAGALEEKVMDEVRRLIRRRTGKRPLVTPIVIEI